MASIPGAPTLAALSNLPKKFLTGHQIKPKGHNPLRAIQDREFRRKQLAKAGKTAPAAGASASRSKCLNTDCKNPNVVDGTCRSCGRVADDSNIVAEVSFGENSQGAAIVQGSFLGADQGSVRPIPGLRNRRAAGNGSAEARERTLRDVRQMMQGYGAQLHIPDHVVSQGIQMYKLASGNNFVQGRKITNVVAVCLYAACRRQNPCKVMLIDLADIVKEEVFYLGRVFKRLLQAVEVIGHGMEPVFVEDLVFRFAAKLEFGELTQKVADTAVRLVRRMDRDWMIMGRRPAGICGACLIMAARMYNFRRTVREVVYVAKVTMITLQMRLDEFKELPSAKMTVEDFLTKDFLQEQHDPPAIYKKRAEYQERLKARRRASKPTREPENGETPVAEQNRSATVVAASTAAAAPAATKSPSIATAATGTPQQPQTDADGFAIPALPHPGPLGGQKNLENGRIIDQAAGSENDQLDALAAEYGDRAAEKAAGGSLATPSEGTPAPSTADSEPARKKRRGPKGSSCRAPPERLTPPGFLDDDWIEDEDIMEMEIEETINDPQSVEHKKYYAEAEKRAAQIMHDLEQEAARAMAAHPHRPTVSDDPTIGEDEFKDDPEVMYCKLSDADVAIRERIWLNNNKKYLRDKQEKDFRARLAPNADKKPVKTRTRKPKMGEGQLSPASTAGEAAVQVMENRGFSKKLNYDAIRRMLDHPKTTGPGSIVSEFTSRQTSRAGSTLLADDVDNNEDAVESEEDNYDDEEDPGPDRDPFASDDEAGGDDDY